MNKLLGYLASYSSVLTCNMCHPDEILITRNRHFWVAFKINFPSNKTFIKILSLKLNKVSAISDIEPCRNRFQHAAQRVATLDIYRLSIKFSHRNTGKKVQREELKQKSLSARSARCREWTKIFCMVGKRACTTSRWEQLIHGSCNTCSIATRRFPKTILGCSL